MKKRCLIVDDDIVSRFVLQAMLEEFFICDMAENGEKALCAFDQAHMTESHYNLICLDITMPGMNGLHVLKHIRETEAALSLSPDMEARVFIISADNTSKTVLSSFFDCGASCYVTKPINRRKILHELTTQSLI